MASWETLPLEIITDILVMLPVWSLIRLQMVSKQFSGIIKSQSFVKLHHSYKVETFRLSLSALGSQDGSTCVLNEGQLTWFRFPSFGAGLRYIDCVCNGLVLTVKRPYVKFDPNSLPLLILWNPATRKSEELPLPNFLGIDFLSYKDLKFGFGYDNKANDFKVVIFRRSVHRSTCSTTDVNSADVYSFNTGAPWKRLKNCIPIGKYKEHHVHVNGALFWLGLNHSDGDFILSFNLSSEVFTKVAMPISPLLNNNHLEGRKSWKLGVYGYDSLALLTVGTPTLPDVVFWVMKKDCDNSEDRESCWMKIHTMRLPEMPEMRNYFDIRDVIYGYCHGRVIMQSSIIFRKKKLFLSDTYEITSHIDTGVKSYYLSNFVQSLFPVSKYEI